MNGDFILLLIYILEAAILGAIAFIVRRKHSEFPAVSYTHLDVYKRQRSRRSMWSSMKNSTTDDVRKI